MNMLEVIRRGAQVGAGREMTRPCPFCGTGPPLAAKIAGRFVVGCESDDCPANPQVSGPTLDDAWARWNRRVL
jgi:hypothetical protein